MAAPKRGPRLGAGPAHQKLLLANLASDLFRHGRITTTETKAKTLRPYAEKLITKAKAGDLHARRQVLSRLRDRDVVAYLFEDVAPRFVDRNGGYTRVLKLGPRPGDHAPMAIIELVEQGAASGDDVIEESKQSRRGLFGRRRPSRREEPEVGAPLSRDALEDVEGIDTLGDVEDGGDVASPDSPAPPDAADSPGPSDAAEADEVDQAAEDDER